MNILLLAQATVDAAPPAVNSPQWRKQALDAFRSLNFGELDADKWWYVANQYGLRALFVLVLMTLAWTLSGWAAAAVRLALWRVKFDETMTKFLARLVRWIILLLVGLTCLSYFGIETTSFAAVIGAAGLAIGLAFQGTLSNFAAGAMLLVFRPYKVGDVVRIAGHLGTVDEIELFTTTIDTADRRRIIVPNSSIYGTVIENITHHAIRRAEIIVGTAYLSDLDETRAALQRAAANVPAAALEPPPEVELVELGPSSVNWVVRAYVRREQFGQVKQALIRAVKLELDRTGISIPFPQMDVHLVAEGEAARPAA